MHICGEKKVHKRYFSMLQKCSYKYSYICFYLIVYEFESFSFLFLQQSKHYPGGLMIMTLARETQVRILARMFLTVFFRIFWQNSSTQQNFQHIILEYVIKHIGIHIRHTFNQILIRINENRNSNKIFFIGYYLNFIVFNFCYYQYPNCLYLYIYSR